MECYNENCEKHENGTCTNELVSNKRFHCDFRQTKRSNGHKARR